MSMEKSERLSRSYLFTVRVWEEELGLNQREWRGQVQLLTTGETRYFREWSALAPLLMTLLTELDTERQLHR